MRCEAIGAHLLSLASETHRQAVDGRVKIHIRVPSQRAALENELNISGGILDLLGMALTS